MFDESTAQLGIATPYDGLLWQQANGDASRYALYKGVISAESSWNPSARRDERRADGTVWDSSFGLMQILLTTARSVAGWAGVTSADLLDPYKNIDVGTAYLNGLLSRYSDQDAVAAYNAGSPRKNALGQYINSRGDPGVQSYVDSVITYQVWFMNNDPAIATASPDSGSDGGVPPAGNLGDLAGCALVFLAVIGAGSMAAWGVWRLFA